ncbi:MAG: glutamate--cysteine ligase [Deltaproteobacteria bacterium]|nr:glutamate--cysteine ligase [Deltaproteobacteria bacterium]
MKVLDPLESSPELGRYNVEFQSQPHLLGQGVVKELENEMNRMKQMFSKRAREVGSLFLMTGILPTLTDHDLASDQMTSSHRYRALAEQVMHLRAKKPMPLNIQGKESLARMQRNIMFVSATSALHLHLDLNPEEAVRSFNLAQILSAPMVALSANSPYFLEKDLWEETRIPLFEQAVVTGFFTNQDNEWVGRVSFGSDYLQNSFLEFFQENCERFPAILPVSFKEPKEAFKHLLLHNGTIWRWNRPQIRIMKDGKIKLRLEHRVMPSGPTVVDMMANCLFFIGLLKGMKWEAIAWEREIPFSKARANFYRAAELGLAAELEWRKERFVSVRDLVLELLPLAKKGLLLYQLPPDTVNYYLDGVLAERVRSGQTGAGWQRRFVEKHGRDFRALTAAEFERQESGRPVNEWTV